MSTVTSRYPLFYEPSTEDDVFTDGGDPLAEVLIPGLGRIEPYQWKIYRWKNEPHSVGGSSSSAQVCKNRHRTLHAVNKKLRCWNKRLAGLLVFVMVFAIITAIPLFVHVPQLRIILSSVASWSAFAHALSSGTGEPCVPVVQHFQEDLFQQCRKPAGDSCTLDVNTALCLMTKTKEDLDRRTQSLDKEIYQQNKWIESQVDKTPNEISGVYSRIPSVHLSLYHSLEPSHDRSEGLDRLTWVGRYGLSPARDMEVTIDEGGRVREVKVTQPGYYYIYSHVTYDSSAHLTKHRLQHSVVKNFRTASGARHGSSEKLLESSQMFTNTDHVSFLQGIFLLKHNDTLSVVADIGLISNQDRKRRKHTFFGAFRI